MTTAEDYSLKCLNLGRMSGVSLGVHAIPDAFLLMHTGVGCKYKAASQIANHDWQRHPNRREGWTEVGDSALIQGSAQRIGPYARSWAQRRDPGVMIMVTATFLEMTGEDYRAQAAAAAEQLGLPVLPVAAPGFEGDLFDGYASLVAELLAQVDWSQAPSRPDEVALLGYFFDRYEADHLGNLQQLRFLLEGLGRKLGPVLLSGRPMAELMAVGRSGHLISMPHLRPVADRLGQACPRPISPVGLPIGLAGTQTWLEQVARATDVDPDRLERFVQAQRKHAEPELAKVADRFRGLSVAVFAEPPLAAGLCGLLVEMGLRPVLVGLRGSSLGGREAFVKALPDPGIGPSEDLEILADPSMLQARRRLEAASQRGDLAMVIGSSVELNLLKGSAGRGAMALEIGFPSTHFHVTRAEPLYGFGGAVAFAQRVLNAGPM